MPSWMKTFLSASVPVSSVQTKGEDGEEDELDGGIAGSSTCERARDPSSGKGDKKKKRGP